MILRQGAAANCVLNDIAMLEIKLIVIISPLQENVTRPTLNHVPVLSATLKVDQTQIRSINQKLEAVPKRQQCHGARLSARQSRDGVDTFT